MEEGNTEEGSEAKRMRVLSIDHLGVLTKVKMGKKGKKEEETEILLNEELEELAFNQDTPLDPEATLKGMTKEAALATGQRRAQQVQNCSRKAAVAHWNQT